MDTNPNNQNQQQNPSVPEEELKMPEEQVGAVEPVQRSSGALIPVLVGILILLLLALGVLFLWGEEIVGMFQPADEMNENVAEKQMMEEEQMATTTDERSTTTEEALTDIEAELESTDFESFDAELEAIDSELETEGSAQ